MLARGYEFVEIGQAPRPTTRELSAGHDEALIQVAGCGVCHTDLGFLYDGVPTRQPLPLILGHEISGVVLEGDPAWVGKRVVVPAVIPCGDCSRCRAGRSMTCKRQVMPGNDRDGGFATHCVVPSRGLCEVAQDLPEGMDLAHLAVIADAVSTPYSALKKSGLQAGQVAVVVGLGGVGGYAAQLAKAAGAFVVGLAVDAGKLAGNPACDLALDPRAHPGKVLRKQIQTAAREAGVDPDAWVIFECSGTAPGQNTAFGLLVHGATLMVVGFTMGKLELRLSNLMAFDARAIGTWGCPPELYPEIVRLVLDGRVDLLSHTKLRRLDEIAAIFGEVHGHACSQRQVLVPGGLGC